MSAGVSASAKAQDAQKEAAHDAFGAEYHQRHARDHESERSAGIEIAERLREAVSATQVPIGDETRVRVTVSIGLASMPADGSTPRDLAHAADQALYAGKRAGRNRTYSRHGPVTPAATDFFPDLGRFHTR